MMIVISMGATSQVAIKPTATRWLFSLPALLLLTAAVLALITLWSRPNNPNVLSRLAATQALVEHGTLVIDSIPYTPKLIDKVFAKGHFYSEKPPTLSLLAAVIYYPLFHAGFRLSTHRNPAYAAITFLLIGVSTLLCLAAFYHALGLAGLGEAARMWMTGGLAFASLLFPWSTTLNNHAFSGAWTFIGFYFLLKTKSVRREKIPAQLLLAGASAGLAAAADSACILFVAGFGLYNLATRELRRATLWYAIAAGIVILPGILINYSVTGDLRPAATHAELFIYPGSHWAGGSESLSGVKRNDFAFAVRYGWSCLFGRNGFLLYDPLLLIALYQGVQLILARKPFWREALLVFILATIFVGYFSLYTTNQGGFSYSIRWFVTLIPLLWFLAFPFFMQWTRAKAWTYGVLFAVSFLIASVGTFEPWPATLSTHEPAFVLNCRYVVRYADQLLHR
jgi:hypothetical protein